MFKFKTLADERETIILIDHFTHEVIYYTCNNNVANKVYKKIGKPHKVNEYGAKWRLPLHDITKLPIGIVKTTR